ncbi:MAG: hypothetical protein VW683_06275 [Betaproteobacteria bacterium]|jgi:flagellin-specific chaperone FliS
MTQVGKLETAIENYRDVSQVEMEFLFDSLLHSLAVASKNAHTQSFDKVNPSLRHAVMISGRLRHTLKSVPVPSLHAHIDDLFDYFSDVLTDSFKLPFVEDIDELKMLTSELRKGIRVLLEPSLSNRNNVRIDASPRNPTSLSLV